MSSQDSRVERLPSVRVLGTQPLTDSSFGAELLYGGLDAQTLIALCEHNLACLPNLLYAADGLLLIRGMHAIAQAPELLLRLSRLFGEEIEDYRRTLTARNMVHERVPQIFIVSNKAPSNRQPPPAPEPPRTQNGSLPTQFPHRRGWHTDQSYRRPPPDVSLFYAVQPAPIDQAQTLYANGFAAYESLPSSLATRIRALQGLHAQPGIGRSEQAVRAGQVPQPLLEHQRPQRQPVVRLHPVTGRPALYLCEAGQMDWVDGPFVTLEPGVEGEGARLLYDLMSHYTEPRFTYTHEWLRGDLIIYDNRSSIHCATWFDASRYERVMWRTTVAGNPGAEYAGEAKSWLPRED